MAMVVASLEVVAEDVAVVVEVILDTEDEVYLTMLQSLKRAMVSTRQKYSPLTETTNGPHLDVFGSALSTSAVWLQRLATQITTATATATATAPPISKISTIATVRTTIGILTLYLLIRLKIQPCRRMLKVRKMARLAWQAWLK